MVALAIGMLAAIVILQVFALSEARSRASTSGGDAQSNGMLTFHQLQSNIARSGYGFNSVRLLSCATSWPSGKTIQLAPVTINPLDAGGAAIIPAGDPNTNTLLVMYGNGDGEPEGNKVDTTNSPSYLLEPLSSASAYTVGDRVVATPNAFDPTAACPVTLTLDRVTNVASTGGQKTSPVTVAAGDNTGTALFNLGQLPSALAYAIRNGNLTVCDFMLNDCSVAANTGSASIWEPIANNIVSLRAQYGRDTTGPPMDGFVDIYDQTTPATACDWARISAVRLALVARSGQFEKTDTTTTPSTPIDVTSTAPVWAGSANVAIDLTKNPDGSANADWKNYRYKLFEAVVPIRNVAWMGVPTGC